MTYDAASRLTSYTAAGGNTVTYDYDKLNALVEKSYTDAAGQESAKPVDYTYDTGSQRTAMEDATGDTQYTYDTLGRITSVTTYRTPGKENKGATSDNSYSHTEGRGDAIAYTYDEADNLNAITYPDGTKVSYQYDKND